MENISSVEDIDSFCDGLAFPTISEWDKMDTDKDISQVELIKAIAKLQNGKSPIEVYRCFIAKIMFPFKNMIYSAL